MTCYDKSGSMSGAPFTALKDGSQLIAESFYGNPRFEKLISYFYADQAQKQEALPNKKAEYQQYLSKQSANGSTNFVSVFKAIAQEVQLGTITDLTVIFFTDGCDTCNSKDIISKELNIMKNSLKAFEVTSRFLTIGFTSGHDALFLNEIATCGSELGNFYYIDTANPNYKAQISECLSNSLSMVEFSSMNLHFSSENFNFKEKMGLNQYIDEESEESKSAMQEEKNIGEKDDNAIISPDTILVFENEHITKEEFLSDLQIQINYGGQTLNVLVSKTDVKEPSAELKMKARVMYVNKEIFNLVQELQGDNKNAKKTMEIYE